MPIPDYQTLMMPLLRLAADRREHQVREAVEHLADAFSLTKEERNEMLPSGTQPLFANRVGWARTYLKQAGLLETPRRGTFRITDRGLALLQEHPDRIDVKLLERYPEFLAFRNRRRVTNADASISEGETRETPEDTLAAAYRQLRTDLEADLLDQVKASSPSFFEKLVIDLLVAMGYGGNRQDAGRAIGQSGDGGIDGMINEDRLGLDVIYVQAKRWDSTVGRPEIQKFAGALQGQRARKGVFITTSNFSQEALDYATRIDSRIILIDGARLAKLMVDHNVGVSVVGAYEVKKIDSDYFTGD
ncbi:MAG: restriction endonuclease [Nitrospirae bacterium]|nr:MAG: restriction endonuclease [Nitrospirota bacterium]